MSVNPVSRNTKRILMLNEELNEQRGMISSLLHPRSLASAITGLGTNESELFSLSASGSYPLYGFLRLPLNTAATNILIVNFYNQNGEVLNSCTRRIASAGAQTVDIPFCIYPAKETVKVKAQTMSACTLENARMYVLGV